MFSRCFPLSSLNLAESRMQRYRFGGSAYVDRDGVEQIVYIWL